MSRVLHVTLLLILLFSFSSLAQPAHLLRSLNFNGSGARAASMGNAFTAVADDATAMSWNAAGLTQLYSMEASVTGRFGLGTISLEDWKIEGISVDADAPDAESKSKFQLNFASFAVPFSVGMFNIVGGIAFRRVYEFSLEETYKYDSGDLTDKHSGGINAITPAIGIQFNKIISAGGALNIYTGSYQYSYIDAVDSDESYDDDEINFSGGSIDIGIMIKPSERFSIGANLNMPYEMTIKFKDDDDEDEKLNVPFFFSLGASFRATDQLLFAIDYHSRPWSNSKEFEDEENSDLFDLNSFHLGMEYLIIRGDAVFPLRIGFYTNPMMDSIKEEDGDQAVNKVFTLGVGLVMNRFIIDAAFEYENSSIYKDLNYEGYDISWQKNVNSFRMTLGATVHLGD